MPIWRAGPRRLGQGRGRPRCPSSAASARLRAAYREGGSAPRGTAPHLRGPPGPCCTARSPPQLPRCCRPARRRSHPPACRGSSGRTVAWRRGSSGHVAGTAARAPAEWGRRVTDGVSCPTQGGAHLVEERHHAARAPDAEPAPNPGDASRDCAIAWRQPGHAGDGVGHAPWPAPRVAGYVTCTWNSLITKAVPPSDTPMRRSSSVHVWEEMMVPSGRPSKTGYATNESALHFHTRNVSPPETLT